MIADVAADATMTAMETQASLRSFWLTCLAGWIILSVAGVVLARQRGIPDLAAIPVILAFAAEFVFYLVPGFAAVREAVKIRLSSAVLAPVLALSALIPYLIYAVPSGQFQVAPFLALACIAIAASFWFLIFPASVAADLGFIVLLAAVFLSKVFKKIYLPPFDKVYLDVLGHLMLIRLGASVMLLQRRFQGLGFGFIPSKNECLVGLRYFLYFLPIGIPLGWALGIVTFQGRPGPEWQAVGIFLGIFWVVALSEEFVFRGVLLQWVTRLTGTRWTALAIVSVIFGLCHLGFRGFPNWRMAIFATVAGAFWGEAYRAGRSIRASMVAHALVVTTWMKWLN